MDREAKAIRGRLEKWTRNTRTKSVLVLVPGAFVIVGPILMVAGVWGPGVSLAVSPDRPVYSTVVIVGTLLGVWYLTRLWTFDNARTVLQADRRRADEIMVRHGIDPETGERITSG